MIYADPCMARMTPKFEGAFVDTVHFAVSGKLVTLKAAKEPKELKEPRALKEPKKPREVKEPEKPDSHDYYTYDRKSPMGEVYE